MEYKLINRDGFEFSENDIVEVLVENRNTNMPVCWVNVPGDPYSGEAVTVKQGIGTYTAPAKALKHFDTYVEPELEELKIAEKRFQRLAEAEKMAWKAQGINDENETAEKMLILGAKEHPVKRFVEVVGRSPNPFNFVKVVGVKQKFKTEETLKRESTEELLTKLVQSIGQANSKK